MLDLLLDPAFLGLAGTIGGGMGLKFVNKRTEKRVTRRLQGEFVLEHKQKKEIEADPSKSIYACKVYSDRLFEYKLVEAGVLTLAEMTTCDHDRCQYCRETLIAQESARREKHRATVQADIEAKKSGREKFNELKAKDGRYKGYRYEDYVFQQRMRQRAKKAANDSICMDCNTRGIHTHTYGFCESCGVKVVDAKMCRPCELQQKHAARKSRLTNVDGYTIARPKNVPGFAVATPQFKHNELSAILWEWGYEDTGRFAFRQPVSTETIEIRDGLGTVRKRIQSVYDPDTGEHLGEVEIGETSSGMTWTKLVDHNNKHMDSDHQIPMLNMGRSTLDLGPN